MYGVVPTAPPLWGAVSLPNAGLLGLACLGALGAVLCRRVGRVSQQACPRPARWLLAAWIVPLLDLIRLTGVEIRYTFLEPLLVAGLTGAAAMEIARHFSPSHDARTRLPAVWLGLVWALAIACGLWWYWEAGVAYDNYLLGYNDFGHFGLRVVNTWEGRGFLMETPSLPAFWDHFNPGLALLAPLWGLWPDARLFFAVQAICLAAPAPLVFGISRRLGADPLTAAAWSAAYLMFPVVGQFNVSYTYGWHPVSLALPALFALLWALLCGRRLAACGLAVVACSFQEDVVVVLACLAGVMALQAWRDRRGRPDCPRGVSLLAGQLPAWGWLVAAAVLVIAFVLIFKLSGFSQFQVSRFDKLGNSTVEILLSPLLRPGVFWGTVMRPRSAYFLLALFVPLGLGALLRGWIVLLATAVPLGVLLAWGHLPATSIAFQYTTALVPVFFLAALAGAAAAPCAGAAPDASANSEPRSSGLGPSGWYALAAGAAASIWFGAMPWTGRTLLDALAQTYGWQADWRIIEDRQVGSAGNRMLNEMVAQVRVRDSSVLATGRVAAHLLGVRRLDTIAQARDRWPDFAAEVGAGRSPVELFDWVVLDTQERFYQSEQDLAFITEQVRAAHYRLVRDERGIVVYARPSPQAETSAGP